MEQPGKILHEMRVGELTHLHEVSQTPSYASVDATLLFLIAIAKHVLGTGDLQVFKAVRSNVDRALSWLERKTAENAAGYVTYDGLAAGGQPINQSWRDSGTGVLRLDDGYPRPPLALVEVQGYAFQARLLIAAVLRHAGEDSRADRLVAAANQLQKRFLREFWMDGEGCYCLGLEQDGRQITSVTSNAAHVLWTGIATPEHAHRTAQRIMRRSTPLAYQQGRVWPFDNALIVSGLRRYGEDEVALRVAAATLDAARGFRNGRLPEFIAGAQRLPGDGPTHTPRADPLQAWSAAAMPFMVSELLGLDADGFGNSLRIRRRLLADGVDTLALQRIRIGNATVSLRFTRHATGTSSAVIANDGGVEVVMI
jgi:glycogen debranching enzyme